MKKALAVGLAVIALAATPSCRGAATGSSPGASNDSNLVANSEQNADPAGKLNPAVRTLQFSGYEWTVKSSDRPVGPGPNYFSDSSENVTVDDQGRLHLHITRRDGRWYCAEVISTRSFGYGTYRFYLDTVVDNLDPQVVLGMFTWNDDPAYNHREIDIEVSRWGQADNKNGQFVVQPYTIPQNIVRFQIPSGLEATTHLFTWKADNVFYQSLKGHDAAPSDSSLVIQEHNFTRGIPRAGGENARINFWLMVGRPPAHAQEEIIISKFEFINSP